MFGVWSVGLGKAPLLVDVLQWIVYYVRWYGLDALMSNTQKIRIRLDELQRLQCSRAINRFERADWLAIVKLSTSLQHPHWNCVSKCVKIDKKRLHIKSSNGLCRSWSPFFSFPFPFPFCFPSLSFHFFPSFSSLYFSSRLFSPHSLASGFLGKLFQQFPCRIQRIRCVTIQTSFFAASAFFLASLSLQRRHTAHEKNWSLNETTF